MIVARIARLFLFMLAMASATGGWTCDTTAAGCDDDADCIVGDPPCMGSCIEGSCSYAGQACLTRE